MEQSKLLQEIIHETTWKRKIHNIILILETKEYSHIVLPASLRNIVLNKLHSKMAHF